MVDSAALERLVHVKSLYDISKDVLMQGSSISTSLAVIILDNSIENYLWLIISRNSPKSIGNLQGSLSNLINEVSVLCTNNKVLFDLGVIDQIHRARNSVQHNGVLLDYNQTLGFFSAAESMFLNLSKPLLGEDWQAVSLSMLIKDEEVAQSYRKAEQFYKNKDFANAAYNLITAFERAKKARQVGQQSGSGITIKRIEATQDLEKYHLEKLFNYAYKIEQELEVKKLDLDYKQWRDYRIILENIDPLTNFSANDVRKIIETNSKDTLEIWLKLNLVFVLEAILKWQIQKRSWDF